MSAFTDFFSRVGHGLSNFGHAIARPLMGAVSSLAPMAGTALGGMFGGPMGAMAGNTLGGMAGNLFGNLSGGGGGGDKQQAPSFQGVGQQLGGQAGNYLNQMLPSQYQGMNLGQLGQSFSSNMGNRLNQMLPQGMQQYGLGQRAGAFLNDQLASRLPSAFQGQTLGGAGKMLGGQGGQYMGNRFGFSHGGGVYGLRDMADLLGHPYDMGGEVY